MTRHKQKQAEVAQVDQKTILVLEADPAQGLTEEQVEARRTAGLANLPVKARTKTVGQIIGENVFTYFNLIFILLATCLVLVGSFKNMLFLGIAVANTIIGIVQQIRSKRTIDKLNLLAAPRANAMRAGKMSSIPTMELVRDDVVELAAGDQISADAKLIMGGLQVNESLITGEADAVEKEIGDDLLSGSFVVAGRGRARLTRVGVESFAAKLTLAAKAHTKAGRSEMMASLDKLIRVIGVLLLPIGLILFSKQYFLMGGALQGAVVSTVAALIGMIPEGLYLLTSVALAVSVIHLAGHKTLVQEMSSIETLARVDVLCVDKTGTITEPTMEVEDLVVLEGTAQKAEEALCAFCHATEPENDTARAMRARFATDPGWNVGKVIPFTSSTKWSATVFEDQGAYIVGAPEFIMGVWYAQIQDQAEPHTARGCRVLLVAQYAGEPDPKGLDPALLTPLALVLLSNRIRPEASETFRYFAQQGVAIKVISGDNPLTVSQVAQQAGIAGAEHWVDAATLEEDDQLAQAAGEYTVFGRVTPTQKRKLVKALQQAGHTVAMTGDGVNDVLALKDADCGIAMASGSDAACHVAQLVLLDSNFSALPLVVAEGRRVINNIQRAASLFLVKNIFSFFLSFITLFTLFTYPFIPIQLTLVGGLTIGIPSFFLALEPNHSLVRGKFMRSVLQAALPGGLTDLFLILGVELFSFAFGFTPEEISTLCTLLIGFVGLVVLFQVCKPFDVQRKVIWGLMAGAMVVAVTLLSSLFSLVALTLQSGVALVLFMLLAYPTLRAVLWAMERLEPLMQWAIQWKAARQVQK